MRKLLIVFLIVLAAFAWAAPKTNLIWMATGPVKFTEDQDSKGFASLDEKVCADFEKAHPDVRVTVMFRDVTQGMLTFDALLAKGTPPDVWIEAAGNANPYLKADYALPLEKYIDKATLGMYQKNLVDIYTREGHVYALPQSQIAGGFAVNLSMLDQIGYKMPALSSWTTTEFVKLSEKLKAAGIPSTMIMTQQGLITWNMVWLYAFGAEMYKGKDYSKVAINSAEALAGLNYIKMLVDKGYAYPHPNELNDDMGVDLFTTGKVFSCLMQNGHSDYWIPEQIKQGKLDKEFKLTFTEVPHAPGREHTPVYGYQAIVVVHKSKDEARNKLAVQLALVAAGKEYQYNNCVLNGGFSTIVGFTPDKGAAARDSYKAIAKLASTAGLMDTNDLGPHAQELYHAWKEPIQLWIAGKLTAQQVLDRYEAEAKKILAQ